MAASSLAAPLELEKRANYDAPPGGDVTILNYALTLEYLERKFYQEGVKNYTASDFEVAGCSETFYENLKGILYDEEVSYNLHLFNHSHHVLPKVQQLTSSLTHHFRPMYPSSPAP